MKKIILSFAIALSSYCSYAQWLPLTAGSGYPLTGPLNINATAYSEISTSNGDFLSIEAFNSSNTVKKPIALAPWGGNVGIGTTDPKYALGFANNATISFNQDSVNPFGIEGGDHAQTRVIMGASSGTASNIAFGVSNGSGYGGFIEKARINSAGYFGIGTATPAQKLTVLMDAATNGAGIAVQAVNNGAAGSQPAFSLLNPSGIMRMNSYLDVATDTYNIGNATGNPLLTVSQSGNVLIGQTTQANPVYKLDVKGKTRADEIVVNTSGADFVFDKKYLLPKLSDVKKYIEANQHLPEIPSAKEMQTNGMSVGQINTKLLQKVEELTLYLIEKDKQLSDQQQNIKLQQAQIDELREQLKSITKFHPQVGQNR